MFDHGLSLEFALLVNFVLHLVLLRLVYLIMLIKHLLERARRHLVHHASLDLELALLLSEVLRHIVVLKPLLVLDIQRLLRADLFELFVLHAELFGSLLRFGFDVLHDLCVAFGLLSQHSRFSLML